MRANIEFLENGFGKFNHEMFDDELPVPAMRISSARSFVGQFKTEKTIGFMGRTKASYCLTLSNRYELEERVLEDVLIHEMIHFLISFRKIRDTSSHGKKF
ncbi:MAG: SprT-like domain-containing protein, partial [Muribaculaceae bacterium]|nr:SprT-like domain-containing protein [Muribaculaceae bacterium]